MDQINPQSSPSDATPAAPVNGAADEEQPAGATVEERDAYWQKRMGGKDRAHAAAEKALREELESLRKAQATPGANGQPGNGDASAQEIERLKAEIAQRDTLYGRKAKYPNLNGKVSDATIMSSDEADLAKFNALFDDSADGGTFIAPTAPKRSAAPSNKRIEDMSKDELLVELSRETARMREDREAG